MQLVFGLLIPFLGTTLGSAMVFFMKNKMNKKVEKILLGFASGVMIAASVWSLLIPSIEMSDNLGHFKFIPAAIGFIVGILFLLVLDSLVPHLHLNESKPEGIKAKLKKTTMLVLAVTIHNIPEGMAVGVTLAGAMIGNAGITMAGALALSIGIAIQNFPEGAIISMPLKSEGVPKWKAFTYGTLSGIVEPIGAIITILLTNIVVPSPSIFIVICSRCNDLCCSRRINSRISGRRTFKYWYNRSCNWLCNNDDIGCCFRIKLNKL